jgi:hypothetical protein
MIQSKVSFLTLPPFPAINAGDKGGHGFVARPRLQLVVRAFRGPALGVRASEVVGGRLHLGFVFVLVAQLLRFNERAPLVGIHFLVRHECQLVRLYLFRGNELNHGVIRHADADGAQAVGIDLHKVPVVPFFHDVFGVRFAQGVIVNAAFQVESRIGGCLRRHTERGGRESCGQLDANIFPELVRVCNLQCGYGIRVRSGGHFGGSVIHAFGELVFIQFFAICKKMN